MKSPSRFALLNSALIFVLALLLVPVSAHAAPPINNFGKGGSFFSDPPRTDVAIKGTDTVAYFTDHKAVPGKDEFVTEWKGAKWKFASKEHLETFKAKPDAYAPQFGGYCVYGVAKDNLVKIEPDQFSIIEGKLYLNYDSDTQEKFKKDPPGYIKTANEKFSGLLAK